MSRRAVPSGVALVGTGRLARALARALVGTRHGPVRIASRTPARARRVAATIRGLVSERDAATAAARARIVVLAVPDAAIEGAARVLAASVDDWRGRVALHGAGALGVEPLRSLASAGAAVGVLHPLQALGDPRRARALFRGARARIEGDPAATRAARALARTLGLVPLRFSSRGGADGERRALYHAAASLASNDVLALLSVASEVLRRSGTSPAEARRALAPMAREVVAQFEALGDRGATGPVARGDASTVERQMEALLSRVPEAAGIHAALGRWLLERASGLDPDDRRRIVRALARGLPRDPEV